MFLFIFYSKYHYSFDYISESTYWDYLQRWLKLNHQLKFSSPCSTNFLVVHPEAKRKVEQSNSNYPTTKLF